MGGRGRRHGRAEREVVLSSIDQTHAQGARLEKCCEVIGISLRTVERWRHQAVGDDRRAGAQRQAANALSNREKTHLLQVMTSNEHWHLSPKQLVPRLADQGVYLASESTIYRLRRKLGLQKQPRPQSRTPVSRSATVHRAERANQVWSWDITYLPTVIRGRHFYLYLMLDVWSRRIVGWRVYERESAQDASELFRQTCRRLKLDPRGLTLHSDNGQPMRGAAMVATLQSLGVIPSFSRPHVSNDNPYSEALFRTLKYTPGYPRLPFADLGAANAWVDRFVGWYNNEHRHSGIRYVTPNQRHCGEHVAVLAQRDRLYAKERQRHPRRWTGSTRNWDHVATVVLDPQANLRKQIQEASATRL